MTFRLPDATRIGHVRLRVPDLPRSLAFYRELLGFSVREETDGATGGTRTAAQTPSRAVLTAGTATRPLVILEEQPGAIPKPRGTTGLYHFAVRLPRRRHLAFLLRRLQDAGWPLQGFSDHGVSEAVYLADPDGIGLELTVDRPRDTWPRRNGELAMTTLPLDLGDLFGELDEPGAAPATEAAWRLPSETTIGHVHLTVSRLDQAETFYHGVLGFDVTVRGYPGALFFAAGGYHHHLGVNTWAGPQAPRPPADASGLIEFSLEIPHPETVTALRGRLEAAGASPRKGDAGWRFSDPEGNRLVLTATG